VNNSYHKYAPVLNAIHEAVTVDESLSNVFIPNLRNDPSNVGSIRQSLASLYQSTRHSPCVVLGISSDVAGDRFNILDRLGRPN